MELGLSGKTAVVTGGAKGFGRAVCRVLAEEGANVVMNYRSGKDEAEALIRQMNQECPGKVFGFQGDMMEESDRKGLFLAACEQFGGADILGTMRPPGQLPWLQKCRKKIFAEFWR